MDNNYLEHISLTTNISKQSIIAVTKLHNEGATIPFMARYRKEVTGNLDEVQLAHIIEAYTSTQELIKRKETILNTIKELGKLTPELAFKIANCMQATVLEDVYLPYKPKRTTKASIAKEKGLESLAVALYAQQQELSISALAITFITDVVLTEQDALQGAQDIIAEWIAEDDLVRNTIRNLYSNQAILTSKVLASKANDADALKYKDYFEYSQTLAQCPSHRLLAIRRAEKEGYLAMHITIEKEQAIEAIQKLKLLHNNDTTPYLIKAIEDSYSRLLKPSIETEYRLLSKNKADDEAITVFADNVQQLLLAAPLGAKNILALDPGYRTGCKLVCLNEQGNLLYHTTIYPHAPQNDVIGATHTLQQLTVKYNIQAIGIGNGTAGRETEQLVRSISFEQQVDVYSISEQGASIYSASDIAREEFPELDVTVRGSISIGRRLLDPLSELVKIDAKSIGVGQYQHDVNQAKLKTSLDRVVASCVNKVGVNVNTASKHLLQYVSGLSSTVAHNIVQYRSTQGAYKSKQELLKVAALGPKTYEQCAGFLRIPNAENILDSSAVHPESYHIIAQMANDLKCNVAQLVQDNTLRKKIEINKYITETIGIYTIQDILKELEKPGLDPRPAIETFAYDATIKTIDDVKTGMQVPGIVTNITSFGAFVDIGVKQDGMVHISQITHRYITDPNQVLKLQQKVQVVVTDVDVARKRIALSMKLTQALAPHVKPKPVHYNKPNNTVSQDDFASKLQALKGKFSK